MLAQFTPDSRPDRITIRESYARAKRFLDITLTLLLLHLLGIATLLIAVAILLDSPGPVFFQQPRVGQNGKVFTLLKFRSMYNDSDNTLHQNAVHQFILQGQRLGHHTKGTNQYKLTADRRITRVGSFIRKTSLDELPQFWQVLHGEMSLVGPRPPLPYEVELYSPHDRLRLHGKPGLTGLWQIYGRSRVPFHVMVQMDIAYLQTQSLSLDIKLILLTLPVILRGRGGG